MFAGSSAGLNVKAIIGVAAPVSYTHLDVYKRQGSDFSVKTTIHIHRLFEKFGFDEVFGRSAVMELLELKGDVYKRQWL